MKAKISFIFLVLAVAMVIGIFSYRDKVQVANEKNQEKLIKDPATKQEIIDYFTQNKISGYDDQESGLNKSVFDSADIVNIHLWASWCAPCVNEVPELIQFAKQVTQKNAKNLTVIFIAVSLDENKDDITKFVKSFPEFNKAPFYRVWDKNKEISKLLNADRLPMTIILNKNIPEPRFVRGVVEWKSISL